MQVATAYVRNTLRGRHEITVDNVEAQTPTERTITLAVYYHVLDDPGAGEEQTAEIVDVTIGGTA